MVYFLMMTWSWWLLAIAIAVGVIWLISRCWSRWNWPTADRGEQAAQAEIAVLKSRIAELEADAARREEPVPAADR